MPILDIIKYEGDNQTFVWKHPCEDFNTLSQLIVHESQEAIFFLDGRALDRFGPGRYSLETGNLPLLRKIVNLPSGGKTPFHCEVYFINKTEQMAIRWGTESKIQYLDPVYHFPLSIGASGEMALLVSDGSKLLIKLVGTEKILDQSRLTAFFRSFLLTRVKTYIAQEMKAASINIFEIDEKLDEFSRAIQARLLPDFDEYGVQLSRFFITTIVKPDGDKQYENFKDLHYRQYASVAEAELQQKIDVIGEETRAKQTVIEAKSLAQKRSIEGYTYQQERGFDVAEGAAKNEGSSGNMAGMGIGLGMMAGVGGTIGNVVGSAVESSFAPVDLRIPSEDAVAFCENCGEKMLPGAKFCDRCGAGRADRQCPNCGYQFERAGNFCPKCGAKRGGAQ